MLLQPTAACNKLFSNSFHGNVAAADLKDSHYAQYMHAWNTLELFRAAMMLLPGTKMTRHMIHTSLLHLRVNCRGCVLKHCIVLPLRVRILVGLTSWKNSHSDSDLPLLSFPAAKRNRWCREKNAGSAQRIDEEGSMMLVIGAEFTTMLWIWGITFYVKLQRLMSMLKSKTKINLFISPAEFGAQGLVLSALRWFARSLIVGMFADWLQHARQKI